MGKLLGRGSPAWAGPREGQAMLSVSRLSTPMVAAPRASIVVERVSEYVDGVLIEVDITAESHGTSPDEALRSPRAVLRFEVRLVDGRVASTLDHVISPLSPPQQPYFCVLGGPGYRIQGNRLHGQWELWLWPRPAEPVELTAQWPLFDVVDASLTIL